ncbi:origin recognition complex subunit 2-like [Heptranchias perlo]|uniref:origin recognition complex subunit 2-like n=1 Tax=Heptranchias perlo TaxID=212740 RepID=UPI00355A2154
MRPRELRFIGDRDVLGHVAERQGGIKLQHNVPQRLVNVKKTPKKQEETERDEWCPEIFNERDYVEALGTGGTGCPGNSMDGRPAAGSDVFTFQTIKRGNKMAKLASELAQTPGKSVTFCAADGPSKADLAGNLGKSPAPDNSRF